MSQGRWCEIHAIRSSEPRATFRGEREPERRRRSMGGQVAVGSALPARLAQH